MLGGLKRRVWTLAVVAGAVLAAAATAFAAGNHLHLKVPHVKVNKAYYIKVSGSVAGKKHLYLFIDSKKCGPNPAVELSRTDPTTGTAYGYYWASVTGSFSHSAGFKTIAAVKDHACAYLSTHSAPKNSAQGVVSHSFKTYKVHS